MAGWELQERPGDKKESRTLSTQCWAEGSRRQSGQVGRQESGGSGWPGAQARRPPARRAEGDSGSLRGRLIATAGAQEGCHSPHGVGRAQRASSGPRPLPRTLPRSPVWLRPAVCPAAASWRVVIDLRRSAGAPAPLGPRPTADGSGQVAGRGWGAPSPLSSPCRHLVTAAAAARQAASAPARAARTIAPLSLPSTPIAAMQLQAGTLRSARPSGLPTARLAARRAARTGLAVHSLFTGVAP